MTSGFEMVGAFVKWCFKGSKGKYDDFLTDEDRVKNAYLGLAFLILIGLFLLSLVFLLRYLIEI